MLIYIYETFVFNSNNKNMNNMQDDLHDCNTCFNCYFRLPLILEDMHRIV